VRRPLRREGRPAGRPSPPTASRRTALLHAACIAKADAGRARSIARGCARDCPECYQGGDCAAYGDGAVTVTGQVVDGLVGQILCDDGASADGLTTVEDRCRRSAGTALAKAARAMGACFVRCRRDEERGKLPPQACDAQPLPATARACLDRVEAGARRTIGKRCADAPSASIRSRSSIRWRRRSPGDYQILIFCASPSGAFVER
jgi:hypothetical protein